MVDLDRALCEAFADPARFDALLAEAGLRLRALTGNERAPASIALSSFSAGYGAIRSILKQPANARRVEAIVLADSLHASYAGDAAAPRAVDLPVDEGPLEPFFVFAEEAAAGRKWMRVTHSEVYPGTYASTTETADAVLRRLALPRRPVLKPGPGGMQQLSEAHAGQFHLSGYAGNSAPDHMDHLFGLGAVLAELARRRPRD